MSNYSEKELWEKFTFKGFVAVSYFAFMYTPLFGFTLGFAIEYFFNANVFKNTFTFYMYSYPVSWICYFLTFCLIPKLQARKEEKKKNSQKRYRK